MVDVVQSCELSQLFAAERISTIASQVVRKGIRSADTSQPIDTAVAKLIQLGRKADPLLCHLLLKRERCLRFGLECFFWLLQRFNYISDCLDVTVCCEELCLSRSDIIALLVELYCRVRILCRAKVSQQ